VTLRIVSDANIPAVSRYFRALGEVVPVDGRNLSPDQLRGADVLLVRSVTRVDEALLRDSDVQFVGTATSGLEHVDLDYLRARGTGFAHAPGANANSVVEYVLAAISALGDMLERLLAGGRVGIVGHGHIGRALSARLAALGIDHLSHDPWLEPGSMHNPAGLTEVLACDVVTLHPELTRREPWPSHHLLGKEALDALGGNQLLINASRGEVVDNRALRRRLARGGGPLTVLDVWEGEPRIDAALARLVNLGSAHIAGYSLDGKLRGTLMLWRALQRHLGIEAPAPPRSPVLPTSPLVLRGTGTNAAIVRDLLSQRYDIRRDDALLRETLTEANPAGGFDRLRRDYRERRELGGSAVIPGDGSEREAAVIHALGCHVADGGE